MIVDRIKYLLVAVFATAALSFSVTAYAQEEPVGEANQEEAHHQEGAKEDNKFDAKEVIFGHVMDAHEFHFFSYTDGEGKVHHASIPLPVILYSPQKGFSVFMSSKFHHGHEEVDGYRLVYKLGSKVIADQVVSADTSVQFYDLSLTRNVVQMFIALAILVWILMSVARRYRSGQGVSSAPKGLQNAIEPIITFIRDEVAKPNIGHKYNRYMPYLLTVFFFILINNIFGLIPGSANVTGNIAFTAVLGVISFLVISFSGNKHYWGHIVNPPVPFGVKFILIPVEILSIFTKPFALIIRLFANMLAGHIIIICLISLIFIFGSISKGVGVGFAPVSIAFATFIYLIEVLIAFIQAYIFVNLTAVFIGQAAEEAHHATDDDHAAHADSVVI